jgi:enoyl-CoA hydratase/carnithine racemase
LETLPCSTVFAAHALTLTAAFEIALSCDLILAAPDAKFGLVEHVVGLTCPWAARNAWPNASDPDAHANSS